MHHHTTKDVQSEMRSKKNLHGTEHTNFTKSSSRKDTARMSTEQNFFRNDVSTKAKNTATGVAIHSKNGVHSRQWRCVTSVGIIFSESQRKVDNSTVKQHSGY